MAKFSRTWWGKVFIEALESFTDSGRLQRGRSYANGGKVKSFDIDGNRITAVVRGSVNPYFGVYKEPTYIISIEITPIAKAKWDLIVEKLSSKASIISRLLLNEVPENIESSFAELGFHLLPYDRRDFQTQCSCPDYANPCKHIAGVYYLVAAQLDENPFLLFELRGLSKLELQKKLEQTPLGKILSEELNSKEVTVELSDSLYTRVEKRSLEEQPSAREFWLGAKRLPPTIDVPTASGIPAIAIKKEGDFPAFWHKDHSFIETMEELYKRVKTKNQNLI
ncbi:hypothetical protein Xen7305DRAFT_00012160 [Xenococcus sp. PCC 7305]|uniref:SWIM zinc finger family protein n=1 Tax=Xenococcus sp. PCC 7305 TaxID=102125 RepID=UPI0002AC1F9C|nr:SWIM zinc finger family protein [Xenococcus sp. PCC 7305]ELS01512.1 hypothetical protein Xen7305DRAFT_00012160 [Xenococcus sp. PCC 7305]